MAQVSSALYALNVGRVSELALARVDLAKFRLAGVVQDNLLPMVLGPAQFRPGSAFLDQTLNDEAPRFVPFVFNAATKAMLVISQNGIQVLVDNEFVTRETVTATVTNGDFTTDLSGWTDSDESGATSSWVTGGRLQLIGTGSNFAIREQQVTVTETGTEHALAIDVNRGPVILAVGSTAGDDDYISETTLRTGDHSLAFTPTGDFHITLKSRDDAIRQVVSINVESAGRVTLPQPWGTDFRSIRHAQSADVMFVANDGIQQRRIERRSQRSWSVVLYDTSDGPFRLPNTSTTTITPSDVSGSVTLTASRDLFRNGHLGSIWRLTHAGQTATASLSGEDQFTAAIRVSGVSEPASADTRPFRIEITGLSGSGSTVTLQRSFDAVGAWVDVESYTTDTTKTFDDGLDNQIIFYRLGIKTGDYSSGTIDATLTYSGSIQKGIARITSVASGTSVGAEVIETFGKAEATVDWDEGAWSSFRGFPGAVALHDGRLYWGWKDRVYGSVSDAFESFSDEVEGDSGPVIRSVATGPIEGIRWLLSVQRLLAGTASQEVSMQSSGFDEPITPTQFTARDFSNRGSADIQAVKVDGRGIYVQRNGKRVYETVFQVEENGYSSRDATRLDPMLFGSPILGLAVQRQPDTRVWAWTEEGTVAVMTYEPDEEVIAWTILTTNGTVKEIGVLPGTEEDEVYMAVERTNSGGAITAVEKMALLTEAEGGNLNKTVDSHVVYSGVSTATISGLDHLEGMEVVAWGDGVPYPGPFTVASGSITLPTAVEDAVVGLAYDGRFRSAKLAFGSQRGSALSQQKRIDHVSLLMANVGWKGIRIGHSFDTMTGLPATLGNGRALIDTETIETFDFSGAPFNGGWGPDERICFQVSSPYSATFMGAVITQTTNEPITFGARQGQQQDE